MQHDRPAIYAIYDSQAGTFTGPLQLWRAEAVAIRAFTDIATDQRTEIARHPQDYTLMYLGDLSHLGIAAITPPRTVINAKTLLDTLNRDTDNQDTKTRAN